MSETTLMTKNERTASAKALSALISQYNIVESGQGTPFWKTVSASKQNFEATVKISNAGGVWLSIEIKDKSYNLNLGIHFDAINTLEEHKGELINVVVAPRIPNPQVTDSDIEAVRTKFGDKAVANFIAARASEKPTGELVLVDFTAPEDEE